MTGVADDLVLDVLRAWEEWPGKVKELYQSLGLKREQLVYLVKKGKQLVKSGAVIERGFKEVKVEAVPESSFSECITLKWDQGRVIRFRRVDQLVEFLKKVAA
tara:strand:- start:436 stop:744 length:309 start_codon:yes stop_codon:yes gene_type:complete